MTKRHGLFPLAVMSPSSSPRLCTIHALTPTAPLQLSIVSSDPKCTASGGDGSGGGISIDPQQLARFAPSSADAASMTTFANALNYGIGYPAAVAVAAPVVIATYSFAGPAIISAVTSPAVGSAIIYSVVIFNNSIDPRIEEFLPEIIEEYQVWIGH